MARAGNILIWAILALGIIIPVVAAAFSPFLAWRSPIYIAAGFSGIIAFALMLAQPLLAANILSGLSPRKSKIIHRWIGTTLITAVIFHIAGLWITSPPDVFDALLLRSPTPFSLWGVIAMWAIFASGLLAFFRHKFRPKTWTRLHIFLTSITILGTIIHALQIEGTMEITTKIMLCILVPLAMGLALLKLRARRVSVVSGIPKKGGSS